MVAPHLYTYVTTQDFAMFLRGFGHPPQGLPTPPPSAPPSPSSPTLHPTKSKVSEHLIPKSELLKFTKELRIPHKGPDCRPQISMESILAHGSTEWEHVGESPKEGGKRILLEAQQTISTHMKALSVTRPLDRHRGIMPNLRSVILGRKDACGWKHVIEQSTPEIDIGLTLVRGLFTRTIMACRPRFICSHSSYGPYQLLPDTLPSDLTNLEITNHVYPQFRFTAPSLFIGVTNKIIAEPGTNFFPNLLFGIDEFDFFNFDSEMREAMKTAFRSVSRKARRRIRHTRVEVYGISRLPRYLTEGEEEGERVDDRFIEWMEEEHLSDLDKEDELFMDKFREMQILRERENEVLDILYDCFLPSLHHAWKDKVVLRSRDHYKGDCDACESWMRLMQ